MKSVHTLESDELDGCVPGVSPAIYSKADFEMAASLIHKATGILLTDAKRIMVYSRLAPLVRESGCQTFSTFLPAIRFDPRSLEKLVGLLTTNHTYFNREARHFEHFDQCVRPGIVSRLLDGKPARMWSVALINAMLASGAQKYRLLARLYGGSNMFCATRQFGKINAVFARGFLAREAIPLVKEDMGGQLSRRIVFRAASGQVRCKTADIQPAHLQHSTLRRAIGGSSGASENHEES